jgi:plasmid stabilization system protein ParE
MTLEVRLRPEAELDLADAAYWYEGQQQGLGRQFVDEVLAVFSVIVETPRLHPVLHRHTRRALLRRFPFGVYYQVDTAAIIVIAVMHGSRNPNRWKGRE